MMTMMMMMMMMMMTMMMIITLGYDFVLAIPLLLFPGSLHLTHHLLLTLTARLTDCRKLYLTFDLLHIDARLFK